MTTHNHIIDRDNAILEARRITKESPVFVDTETTGLSDVDEIVEIAILDKDGYILLRDLVRPTVPISLEASARHGILDRDVEGLDGFAAIYPRVCELLEGKMVCFYNAAYDVRKIRHSAAVTGCSQPLSFSQCCVMELYAVFYGEWNSYHGNYKWQGLTKAARACGIEVTVEHRAWADAETTRRLLDYMAGYRLSTEPEYPEPQIDALYAPDLGNLLRVLASARADLAEAKAKQKAILTEAMASEDYVNWSQFEGGMEIAVNTLTNDIKRMAVAGFDGNKKPVAGVAIKEKTVAVVTDPDAARKYALEQAPAYVSIDLAGLAKLAPKLAGTPHELAFVRITKELVAEIASDLSAYLPESEPAKTEDSDSTIPF